MPLSVGQQLPASAEHAVCNWQEAGSDGGGGGSDGGKASDGAEGGKGVDEGEAPQPSSNVANRSSSGAARRAPRWAERGRRRLPSRLEPRIAIEALPTSRCSQ